MTFDEFKTMVKREVNQKIGYLSHKISNNNKNLVIEHQHDNFARHIIAKKVPINSQSVYSNWM